MTNKENDMVSKRKRAVLVLCISNLLNREILLFDKQACRNQIYSIRANPLQSRSLLRLPDNGFGIWRIRRRFAISVGMPKFIRKYNWKKQQLEFIRKYNWEKANS